jgi:hypothetical protein
MPTRHRRINVTCDRELDAALRAAGNLVDAQSDAGRVRALALLGAETLVGEEPISPSLAALRARPGVRPALINHRDFPLPPPEGRISTAGTDVLEWVRGPR